MYETNSKLVVLRGSFILHPLSRCSLLLSPTTHKVCCFFPNWCFMPRVSIYQCISAYCISSPKLRRIILQSKTWEWRMITSSGLRCSVERRRKERQIFRNYYSSAMVVTFLLPVLRPTSTPPIWLDFNSQPGADSQIPVFLSLNGVPVNLWCGILRLGQWHTA